MLRKPLVFAMIVPLALLSLSACVRSASRAPEATPTTEFPLPGSTEDILGQLSAFATQTAIALNSSAATPEPIEPPLESPSPQPTQPPSEPVVVPSSPEPQPTPQFTRKERPIPKTYTLRKGEHPYCIARRFDVNPITMLQLSGLSTSGTYPTGTVLTIPRSGSFPGERSLKKHPTTYTVQSGDTIFTIACQFGDVWPEDIAEANGLKLNANLKVGQELYIP
ncbi:MAG: LysM peptidoglycan-binding domain-containing protein [Anaerolineales bacterium]|nr:LysM peptidoglycan-binding domain-containing protein [Anaerolineales bacterium]MCS7246961.1 LysM peptidoglycan-binding domain-containing protein [Anaerolineales bacterium]MDW8160772.1 LysM peptidoglycan-binding domain-containing protein [Anaerolineales bacterium]MDW8445724.1 LysM peptidoglycan-binding domain-containing protein [Anaerolineales bacterium]